jgi:hypothetical protein
MKIISIPLLVIAMVLPCYGQSSKAETLERLESTNLTQQSISASATTASASRLFGTKDDLTTVILIIPSGSKVEVLGSDSTYYHVIFEENEGFIFKRQAVLDKTPVAVTTRAQPQQRVLNTQPQQNEQVSRFAYLENKYGSNMAARLSAGKIWKGMNAEMVKDSWGTAEKITRKINGNIIQEEWIFKSTWLYFENNTLVDWGPIQK